MNIDNILMNTGFSGKSVSNTATFEKKDPKDSDIECLIDELKNTISLEDYRIVAYIDHESATRLNLNVNWLVRDGDTISGVKVDYDYGDMKIGDIEIIIIASTKFSNVMKYSNILRMVIVPKNDI